MVEMYGIQLDGVVDLTNRKDEQMKKKSLGIEISKKDIEAIKKGLTRAYDPIEYDQSYHLGKYSLYNRFAPLVLDSGFTVNVDSGHLSTYGTDWSQTDDVVVELLDVIFDYCSLADSYVTLCREYGDEV